jgi:alpha-beta hydrolase superfamily lysophospholipase
MKRLILAFCMLLACVASSAAVDSRDFTGVLNDAPYKIRVPTNDWNGVLILHSHWYYYPPPLEPEAAHGGTATEDFLLSNGYAVAGSTFRGSGWQVKEGTHDLVALSGLFNDLVGKPAKRILVGYSMGSLIALKSAEEVPLYDGAIPMCSLAGTTPVFRGREAALALAYATAFGWPTEWGTWFDVRDDLSFFGDVYPVVLAQLMDPSNIGKFEFIRLLFHLPLEGFYAAPPPENPALLFLMLGATEASAEIEKRAKGYVSENAGHVYSLTQAEKDYLLSLGVDAEWLLESMNAGTTITAGIPQRQYADKYFDPTGDLRMPVLTVHSIRDHEYPAHFETRILEKVQAASREDLLLQVYTDDFGHCSFTDVQLLAAIQAMESWLDTGTKPDSNPATSEFFPHSKGFVVPDPGLLVWPIGKK